MLGRKLFSFIISSFALMVCLSAAPAEKKNTAINDTFTGSVNFGSQQSGRTPLVINQYFSDSQNNAWSWTIDKTTSTINNTENYTMIGNNEEGGPSNYKFTANFSSTKSINSFKTVCQVGRRGYEATGAAVTLKVGDTQVAASNIVCTATEPSEIGFTTSQYEGNSISIEIKTSNASTDVYLMIKSLSYTFDGYEVTFDVQGHGVAPQKQRVTYGSLVTKPNNPIDTYYSFVGWYKESDCTNPWNFSEDTITYSTILYAKWLQIPNGVGVGGYVLNGETKKQIVSFGFIFPDYDKLNSDDTVGIYLYSDQGTTQIRNYYTTDIASLKTKKGNFYCIYYPTITDTTFFAKAYIKTSCGSESYTFYSNMPSATGNYSKQYILP